KTRASVSDICIQRVQSQSGIKGTSDVSAQTIDPNCGVTITGCIAKKRKRSKRGIPYGGGPAKEGVLRFSSVVARVATIRRGRDSLRNLGKNKRAKRKEYCCVSISHDSVRLVSFCSCNGLFLALNSGLLCLDFLVFFEELIEQHCVHLIVAHAIGFAVLVPRHQV